MLSYRFTPLFLVMIMSVLVAFSPAAWGLPTILNYCPTVDLIPENNILFQASYYKFQFTDDAAKAAIKKDGSMIYSLGYGFKKAEVGVDVIGEKSFSNMDSALYAGPVAWNVKYRLLTQGTGTDKFSLVLGAFNLGTKSYNSDYYGASPYIMAAKAFKDFRLHLGYQVNILGYKRLDTDRKTNNDILAGFDAVIIKHKTRPLSLMVDYTGGPGKMIGVGLWQTLSPNWAVGISTYHPLDDELPVSKFELPKQVWVGVTYYLPL